MVYSIGFAGTRAKGEGGVGEDARGKPKKSGGVSKERSFGAAAKRAGAVSRAGANTERKGRSDAEKEDGGGRRKGKSDEAIRQEQVST